MENEVVIDVRVDNKTRSDMALIEREMGSSGKRSGDTFRTGLSGSLFNGIDKVATSLGASLATGLGALGAKLPGVMGSAVEGLPPQGAAIAGVLVAGLAVALAPLLAAALGAAVLVATGGGVLALGIKAAADDPRVKTAFGGLATQAKAAFKGFGDPFVAPLVRAAGTFAGALKDIGPVVKDMGKTIAPVIDKLAPAVVGFLKSALPGIAAAVTASVPLFQTLAEDLPGIGTSVSNLFKVIADHGPEANEVFNGLLEMISGIIDEVGWMLRVLFAIYDGAKKGGKEFVKGWDQIVGAIRTAYRWVSDLVGSVVDFAKSVRKHVADAAKSLTNQIAWAIGWAIGAFQNLASRAISALASIPKRITIDIIQRISSIGSSLWHDLTPFAHGGITGAATGGLHGGLRLVGEHGPELAQLPPGTRINSNPDTERLLGGGGGGGQVVVQLILDGAQIAEAVIDPLRGLVRKQGRGSVQTFLGQKGVA